MKAKFDIFRQRPGASESYRDLFELEILPGHTILDVFHRVQEELDPSFAYRYSCRGAICGSCAVRINGVAALACKTQAAPLAQQGVVVIDPLNNLGVIKDLVVDFAPFWTAFERVRPFIERQVDEHNQVGTWDDKLSARHLDQLDRAIDCIKCAACFSDCPKREQDVEFIGPAASVTLYKFFFDPRDDNHNWRVEFAGSPGGVVDCDSYANCVKVCPKDCRPLRAINLIKQDISSSRGSSTKMDPKAHCRIEKDSIGELEIPADAYYGVNVARALVNFPISTRRIHPRIIEAYCRIKRAAASVNMSAGRLPEDKATAIQMAADELLSGKLRDQFVIDMFQAGAGTSTNMNANEVLCNRALELLGHEKGTYSVMSPNDHVNMGQSTNDTYPTAMHLAAVDALDAFYPEAERLVVSLKQVGERYGSVIKSGRTHLQDAVPVTLGGEFSAYADAVRDAVMHVRRTAEDLLDLAIGGSAVGTGMNTHPEYAQHMVAELGRLTGKPFRKANNLVHAMQSQAPVGRVSSALRDFAVELGRIANDLRLLSSGPTTGLAEIGLPEVQAGSSIMPGKVNPSIPEMVNMVCYQVIGNDLTVSQAVAAGQMELNVMMPIMAENVLESAEILASACRQLAVRCVDGITVNEQRCRDYAYRSMGLATALAPYIGYLEAATVAKRALAENETITELVRREGMLSDDELERLLDPERMTRPDPDLATRK